MTTYVVTYALLGKVRTIEVWAASASSAKREAQDAHPDATIMAVSRRVAI